MKKTIVLVSGVMMMNLLIVSCNVDDGTSCPEDFTGPLTTSENEFVGEWALIDAVSEIEVDLTDDDVENPSTQIFDQFSDCTKDLVYNFNNDRTFSVKQGYNAANCNNKAIVEGTWKINGDLLTTVAQCSSQTNDITISDGNTNFTIENNYRFNDVYGFIISTKVTFTYGKILTQ